MRRGHFGKTAAYKPFVRKPSGIDHRTQILELMTDKELAAQLDLSLWELKRVRPDDPNASVYANNWYSSVCEEYRRRGKTDELKQKIGSKQDAVSQVKSGRPSSD